MSNKFTVLKKILEIEGTENYLNWGDIVNTLLTAALYSSWFSVRMWAPL